MEDEGSSAGCKPQSSYARHVTGTAGLPESQSFARGQPVAELGCVGGGVGGKGVHNPQLSPM